MKNKAMFFAILLIALIQSAAYSQERLQKGNYFIGGGIGFSTRDESQDNNNMNQVSEYDYTRYSLSPYSGKFIKDGLAVGLGIHLLNEKSERKYSSFGNLQTIKTDGFSIGATIFLKKYWPISEKFGAFLAPGLGYSFSENESRDESDSDMSIMEVNSNTISLSTDLGIYYFISPRFSIETNLANVLLSKQFREEENRNTSAESGNSKEVNNLNFSLINQFSFDKIIVINYYF